MLFKNSNIFVGGQFQHGSFRVENGRFAEILTTVPAEDGIDLNNQYVIPGLVDVHNHGNSGADFSDGDYDGLVKMARYLAQNGVTSFAPASMTLPYDVLEAAYKTAVQLKKAQPEGCARLNGIKFLMWDWETASEKKCVEAVIDWSSITRLEAAEEAQRSYGGTYEQCCAALKTRLENPRNLEKWNPELAALAQQLDKVQRTIDQLRAKQRDLNQKKAEVEALMRKQEV